MDYFQMMRGACNHDSDAIVQHDERYRRWMVALAARYVRNDAEEVIHDVFSEVHLNKRTCDFTVKAEPSWRAYLRRMASSRSIDRLRARKNRQEVAWPSNDFDVEETTQSSDDSAERLEWIAKCAESLSSRHREAFELRAGGLSSAEVAERMGIAVTKVYVYYSEAMKAIKERVEGKLA
ncbi:MAG: RNA polymerase sigma factor [Pirellulaceae bacterium]|nr:RNA polymerase sigma factor [Pirellulaceae bacterium]